MKKAATVHKAVCRICSHWERMKGMRDVSGVCQERKRATDLKWSKNVKRPQIVSRQNVLIQMSSPIEMDSDREEMGGKLTVCDDLQNMS